MHVIRRGPSDIKSASAALAAKFDCMAFRVQSATRMTKFRNWFRLLLH